jgi:hypothetical protein
MAVAIVALTLSGGAGIVASMALISRRMSASIEGDFVVFLIGARLNRWWKIPASLWFVRSMPKLLEELRRRPESGFLGGEMLGPTVNVQYWRSVEQLLAYARSDEYGHYPYWVRFNRKLAKSGDFGIWHETYIVRAGQYECIYKHMPPFGLGKVGHLLEASGSRETARGRLGSAS